MLAGNPSFQRLASCTRLWTSHATLCWLVPLNTRQGALVSTLCVLINSRSCHDSALRVTRQSSAAGCMRCACSCHGMQNCSTGTVLALIMTHAIKLMDDHVLCLTSKLVTCAECGDCHNELIACNC